MTQTAYPIQIEQVIVVPSLKLTLAEEKLITRLREVRRKGKRLQFIVDPLRMTLTPIDTGEIEELAR